MRVSAWDVYQKILVGPIERLADNYCTRFGAVYHWPTVANAILGGMTRYFYANANFDKFEAIVALEQGFNDLYHEENGAEIHAASLT